MPRVPRTTTAPVAAVNEEVVVPSVVVETPVAPVEVKKEVEKATVMKADLQSHEIVVKKPNIKNTKGEEVPVENYFFAPAGEKPIAPPFFNKSVGLPVDREDLIEIFNKIFKPEDNFVFLKSMNKEVYGVLIPLKFTKISNQEDSVLGEFQYHAISFVLDGSVNISKLISKLKEISTRIDYKDR